MQGSLQIYLQLVVLHFCIFQTEYLKSAELVELKLLIVYTSISLPVLLDKGNLGNEVSGFQEKNNFPLMWFLLHFTPSLHFTFSLQSAFYLWSAVLSPQSLFYTDRMENLEGDLNRLKLLVLFENLLA